MDFKMDPKKFRLYYVPVAVLLIILGRVFPEIVREHTVAYYVILVGWAFFAERFASRRD